MPLSRPQSRSSAGIVITSDTLTPGIKMFGVKLNVAVGALMKQQAPKVQNYARSNAPWVDRTGNARQGLIAEYGSPSYQTFMPGLGKGQGIGTHVITLSHSVPYGIWLEIRAAGKNAIIGPTIDVEGARIMELFRQLVLKLKAVPV